VSPNAGEGFLAVARVINIQSRITERFDDSRRQRALVFHHQHRGPAHRLH